MEWVFRRLEDDTLHAYLPDSPSYRQKYALLFDVWSDRRLAARSAQNLPSQPAQDVSSKLGLNTLQYAH